ncbi:MAG: sigma-54-dependent Fis family transcriptional regulator [Phycisphaerales bacterium]|nr:sigma-54-dependent Fis family transcriptional regulator [Phycisphaerales bacterium]
MEFPLATILIIEDERTLRTSIRRSLEQDGHTVSEAACLKDAREAVRQRDFDAVITDVNLVGESGIEFLAQMREDGFDGAVIVMTAYGTIDSAVDAMKRGADEFLQKPLSLDELNLVVRKTLENRRLLSRVRLYERLERVRTDGGEALGASPAWAEALSLASRFARLPTPRAGQPGELPTILLLGETGAGKGVLAQHIHKSDPAASGGSATPFVHVNCAALPATLIEGELFGHEKGAFTDAKDARPGLFEMAEGGTIFLDEIGEMPLEMQAKLLTVVEQGRFRRLGGTKERVARARIVAATNLDLEERVAQGAFRRDLLYRLNALTIRIPSLRERGSDVILIAEAALRRLGDQQGRPAPTLGEDAKAALQRHAWPGNVRELLNVVKRACILCEGDRIGAEHLGLGVARGAAHNGHANGAASPGGHGAASAPGDRFVCDFDAGPVDIERIERSIIEQALRRARGNVSLAAKLIGLNRGALRYRIERFGLEPHPQGANAP